MPVTHFALVSHDRLDDIVAWRHGQSISVRQFIADVRQLAAALPEGRHLLNACSDRYHFTVGLGAALLTQKISLLPPTHTPEMIRQLKALAPDLFCLSDAPHTMALPGVAYASAFAPGTSHARADGACEVPLIPGNQPVAEVFTSGSTGLPQPHRKSWASLVQSARAEAARLGLPAGPGTPAARAPCIVGTVPPQHMFGFESTVLLALQNGAALHAGQPFYPADIVGALQSVPRPRVLVSTPVHLRVLLSRASSCLRWTWCCRPPRPCRRRWPRTVKRVFRPRSTKSTAPPKPGRSRRGAARSPTSGCCSRWSR
jgi:acyl-coenzyme A synthetase/AMP-(fatty) acid ligase